MNINIFKLITAIIALFFVVATSITAQEAKTIYITKNGKVTHMVAVSDIDSIIFYKPESAQPDFVLINGVKWATRNVDAPGTFAANPEDAGMFYQWNRSKGWPATGNVTGWNSSYPTGTTWETANNVCPTGYRVPTSAEIQSLIDSGSQWTTRNGVNGRIFGRGSNTIFLPAAGARLNNGALSDAGKLGSYWSSTPDGSYAYLLGISSSYASSSSYYRDYARSVRCVLD